jgi:hypothetical protein
VIDELGSSSSWLLQVIILDTANPSLLILERSGKGNVVMTVGDVFG